MFIALTGTPGTGKTTISILLQKQGYEIIDLNKLAVDKQYITGFDKKRDTKLIDIDALNDYIKTNYKFKELVFIEGHASHLLKTADKIIILRCHPKELKKRLEEKGWKQEKIRENVEAETLDVVLCEAVEIHSEENIFEIDTTNITIKSVFSSIEEIINNKFNPLKKYNIGNIDWSEEILKDY